MSGGSRSMLAYEDVKEVFNRALESEKGLLIKYHDEAAAKRFIFRGNAYRALCRAENTRVYPEETHPMHGRTVYDTLSLRRQGNNVRVEKILLDVEIEELK